MSVVKGRNSDGRQNRLRYRFAPLRAIRPQCQYEDKFSRFISKRNPISTLVGSIFVVVVCDATGGAVAEPILKTIGVLTKSRKKYKNLYGIKLERDQS